MDAVFEAQGLDGILLMNQCRSQYWEGGAQARCTMDVHSPTTGEGQVASTALGFTTSKLSTPIIQIPQSQTCLGTPLEVFSAEYWPSAAL